MVATEAIGDEFAKSPLLADYIKEFDITDKLFYQVWKEMLDKSRGIEVKPQAAIEGTSTVLNPFAEKTGGWKV